MRPDQCARSLAPWYLWEEQAHACSHSVRRVMQINDGIRDRG
jgi:hypothetical protein